MAIVNKSPNKNNIHFLGYRTDVLNLVKTSDAFVLPSIFGEATTKAVIEAMSLGVAPIITDIPGNKGLVVNGECGLVVPPKNAEAIAGAILKLYNDRNLCEKFGQNAQAHIAKHFNVKTTVLKIKELYMALLEKG